MPNWCDNRLYITGPSEDQKAFRGQIRHVFIDWGDQIANLKAKIKACRTPTKKIRLLSDLNKRLIADKDERYLFASFVQPPVEVISKGYSSGGYDWCVDHWGTKWDVDDFVEEVTTVDEVEEHTLYSFQSAWSPPIEWLKQVGLKFPTLRFSLDFYEGGCWFAGTCTVHDKEWHLWHCPTDQIKNFARERFGVTFDEDTEEDTPDETTSDEGP